VDTTIANVIVVAPLGPVQDNLCGSHIISVISFFRQSLMMFLGHPLCTLQFAPLSELLTFHLFVIIIIIFFLYHRKSNQNYFAYVQENLNIDIGQ